jgi:hypothetical protein
MRANTTQIALTIAVVGVLVFAAIGPQAYAAVNDTLIDNLTGSAQNIHLNQGESTGTITYAVKANGACDLDATATPTDTFTPVLPAGITASPTNLSFTTCGDASPASGETHTMTFTVGSGADPLVDKYHITFTETQGINTNAAAIDIYVKPPVPVLSSPADGATVSDNTPTLTWLAVDSSRFPSSPPGSNYNYEIQIDDESSFAAPLTDSATGILKTVTSYTPLTSLPDGTYYWHVRVTQGDNVGEYSTPFSFTISTVPVDSTNPTVTDVSVSDLVISEADVTSTFTVTVTYSEDMDESVNPTIGFTPSVATTLTLPTAGGWADATHFSRNYTVADGNVELQTSPDVTINVSGAKDLAGNTQTSYDASDAFTIDTIAPTVTGTADRAPDSNGWYNHDVTITWNSTDADKVSCDDATVYSGPDTDSGGTDVSGGSCTDDVANVGTAADFHLKYDETAPDVTLIGGPADGGTYYFGFVPSAPTCSASDPTPGSGLTGSSPYCTVNGYSTIVGSHTVNASASDFAGNTGYSESHSYTVNAWTLKGFYQPVDMDTLTKTMVNTVKGGSTVPFKFEIFAGPTEFTSTTFNDTPIGTFSAKKVACDSSDQPDDIEVLATGGTVFRYDSTSGQFVYNWQIPKGAGICYDTTFTSQDGSSLIAHFKSK